MTRLPCMAVKQPWADLLVRGIKDVENRNSAMHANLVGQWCAIYASRTLATAGQWIDAYDLWKRSGSSRSDWPLADPRLLARKQCVRGAIVGLVRWEQSNRWEYGKPRSPWANPGVDHWTYSDRIVLPEPVPLPDGGKQSLYWYLDDEIARLVVQQTERVTGDWFRYVAGTV